MTFISQDIAGSAHTDNWIAQTEWNIDKADGNNSLHNLIHTNGNVYRIQYQWLGYGLIEFDVENSEDGRFIPVHRIKYANSNTVPSMAQPSLPFSVIVDNGSTSSDIVIKSASLSVYTQGSTAKQQLRHVFDHSAGVTNTNEHPLMTIKPKVVNGTVASEVVTFIDEYNFGTEGTNRSRINIYKNIELTTGTDSISFSDVGSGSVIEAAVYGSEGSPTDLRIDTTTGIKLGSVIVDARSQYSALLDKDHHIVLNPRDTLTITGQRLSSGSVDLNVSISWLEDF